MVSALTLDVYPVQTADKTQQLMRSTIRQWQITLCNKMKKLSLLESRRVILANTNMFNLSSGIHHFHEKWSIQNTVTTNQQTKQQCCGCKQNHDMLTHFCVFKINHKFRFPQKIVGNRTRLQCAHKNTWNCPMTYKDETRHSTLQKKCKNYGMSSVPSADYHHNKPKWQRTDHRR